MDRSSAGKLGASITAPRVRRKALKKYYANPLKCLTCGRILKVKKGQKPSQLKGQKFCSHSCAAKSYLGVRRIHLHNKFRPCLSCGGRINRHGCRYCSQCAKDGKNKKIIPFEFLKTDRSRRLRIIQESGHICQICYRKTWNGKPIPLLIDHVNGNSDDNSRANLRVVCGNCDMQLPTYKGKNKGKGRHYRRIRYSQGRSF